MNDAPVRELLESLTPDYRERRGDWEAVVRDASRRSSPGAPPRGWRAALAAAVALAAALAVLAWPFGARDGGILERALAAIGDEPVLHVVLRGERGGTLIDLETGARRPMHREREVWYDTERGLVHWVFRLGGVVQHDVTDEPTEPPPELEALVRDYRHALESGTARVAGEATLDGEPVVWVTIRTELLPDSADGKEHEWAQQVAVSRRTFEPVALRQTRDGEGGPYTGERVLVLELLPEGAVHFDAPAEARAFVRADREPIELGRASAVLGRTPLWLGRSHGGLPLARVFRETTALARPQQGSRRVPRRFVWEEERHGLALFYGTLGDDPRTSRNDPVPLLDRPYVTITQSPSPLPGAPTYPAREGSVFVAAGARTGSVQVDRLHVTIEARDEESILAAARALAPMPPP